MSTFSSDVSSKGPVAQHRPGCLFYRVLGAAAEPFYAFWSRSRSSASEEDEHCLLFYGLVLVLECVQDLARSRRGHNCRLVCGDDVESERGEVP